MDGYCLRCQIRVMSLPQSLLLSGIEVSSCLKDGGLFCWQPGVNIVQFGSETGDGNSLKTARNLTMRTPPHSDARVSHGCIQELLLPPNQTQSTRMLLQYASERSHPQTHTRGHTQGGRRRAVSGTCSVSELACSCCNCAQVAVSLPVCISTSLPLLSPEGEISEPGSSSKLEFAPSYRPRLSEFPEVF